MLKNIFIKTKPVIRTIRNNIKAIILTLIIISVVIFFHYYLQPRYIVDSAYHNPDNSGFIDINKQVIKSISQSEFIKGLRIKIIHLNFTEVTILASYPAPNYLDKDNALIGDIIKLKSSLISWDVSEIRSTYVAINNGDVNQAQKDLENSINNGEPGLNQDDVNALISQNKKLLTQYQSLTTDNKTKDNKLSFNITTTDLSTRLEVIGGKSPNALNPIYAKWADDSQNLFYVDKSPSDYSLIRFNVLTGQQDVLYKSKNNQELIGFINYSNYIAITSNSYIGILNLKDLSYKKVLDFPIVGLNNDQIYIPNISLYDKDNFQAEVYDQNYLNNHKIALWIISWNGKQTKLVSTYIDASKN